MPKKTRRATRKSSKSRTATPRAAPSRPAAAAAPIAASLPSRAAASTKADLAQEYQYVFADLRKIAVIAAAMFALLFILAFVLR